MSKKQNPGDTVIKLRPYYGKTIDEIASTERGLLWLDKTLGSMPKSWESHKQIKEYLSDPAIERELNDILDSRD